MKRIPNIISEFPVMTKNSTVPFALAASNRLF
jgi:hypothetical protein